MKPRRSKSAIAIDEAVGARLRNLRLRNKFSQTRLGEEVNVTFQQIQKYEKGTNRVSAGHLARFAKLFGVPVAALYGEVDGGDQKATKRTTMASTAADRNVVRLVKAFQSLKDKNLKAAIVELAEKMAQRHRRSR